MVLKLFCAKSGSDSTAHDSGTLVKGTVWEERGLLATTCEGLLLAMAGVGDTESKPFLLTDDLSALKFLDRKCP